MSLLPPQLPSLCKLSPLGHIQVNADWNYSEKLHESQNGSRTHFTAVFQEDKGNHIKAQHISV